jgi:hypothetical protein
VLVSRASGRSRVDGRAPDERQPSRSCCAGTLACWEAILRALERSRPKRSVGGVPQILVRSLVALGGDRTGDAELFQDHERASLLNDSPDTRANDRMPGLAEKVARAVASAFVNVNGDPDGFEAVGSTALADEWNRSASASSATARSSMRSFASRNRDSLIASRRAMSPSTSSSSIGSTRHPGAGVRASVSSATVRGVPGFLAITSI